ncbi:MAG: tetratricopeptide repeat protein [Burkholderiales bacterium]|nr:tetratricopeptide repeat protein [Burkholderiales bacterium]
MKRDLADPRSLTWPAEQVELALAGVEAGAAFRGSPRHRALLRHVVERMLAGDLASLKETMIAVEVFGRPVASFDPKFDTIVRVEARRLRARLAEHYRGEGRASRLRIELPVGSYVPQIALREAEAVPDESTRRALDLIERGEHFLRQALSKRTLETALARFDEAIRVAPETAAAYVGLGRAWLNLATGWHHEPAIAAEHAAEALRRALELDPGNAVAHALLGAIQNQFERDWRAAERSFKRALALAPQLAFVHSAYGSHLFMRGEIDRAESELALARRLDPQYVNSRAHMVNLFISQGRLDDARAEVEAMRDIAPGSTSANGLSAVISLATGDPEAAVALYAQLCELTPDSPGCLACLAGAHAAAGRLDVADRMLAELHRRFARQIVSPYVLAVVEARAGRADAAFALLERADDERDPSALLIPHDVSFDNLHADPRWPALAAKVRGETARRRAPAEAKA